MRMYDAFKVMDDEENIIATVWWTGTKLESDDPIFLEGLKDHCVAGLSYHAGKEFFDKIPSIYRSGYMYTRKAKVDSNGKLIQD